MNPSRIENAIDEIYGYVESCKPSKLYPNKVVVEKGELYDLLDELRMCAPEEIKRYQKIISNRDGILSEAQQRAEDMLNQAQAETAQILDQNEIVQTAYQRAEEIMNQATDEARRVINEAQEESQQMRVASLMYTNDLLNEARHHLEESLQETENKYRMLSGALKNSIHVMKNNQEELESQLKPEKYAAQQEEPASKEQELQQVQTASTEEDEFDIPEDAFLKNVEQ